jgi:hypothetical protein
MGVAILVIPPLAAVLLAALSLVLGAVARRRGENGGRVVSWIACRLHRQNLLSRTRRCAGREEWAL